MEQLEKRALMENPDSLSIQQLYQVNLGAVSVIASNFGYIDRLRVNDADRNNKENLAGFLVSKM